MRSIHLKASTLKCRVGYVDDEEVVTWSKLSRMEIDDTRDISRSLSSRADGISSTQSESESVPEELELLD
jgi:hypothetical protein